MLDGIPLFNVIQGKLQYHSARAQALAQNVANVDTPNYKARDVKAPDFAQIAAGASSQAKGGATLARTHSGHLSGHAVQTSLKNITRPTTYELNPNGNNVSIEDELINVSRNQSEYQRSLTLYRKMTSMMNSALGRNGGQ